MFDAWPNFTCNRSNATPNIYKWSIVNSLPYDWLDDRESIKEIRVKGWII
jgi:hypothetical protein